MYRQFGSCETPSPARQREARSVHVASLVSALTYYFRLGRLGDRRPRGGGIPVRGRGRVLHYPIQHFPIRLKTGEGYRRGLWREARQCMASLALHVAIESRTDHEIFFVWKVET